MTTTVERPVAFNVTMTLAMLERLGCVHAGWDTVVDNAATCRPCSITFDIKVAMDTGEMDLWWEDALTGDRTFHGSTTGPFAKKALARMIALAQGHLDPCHLKGWYNQ